MTVQVVDTIRFGPEHVEQALHGVEPDEDQVEPAIHALGPAVEQIVFEVFVQAEVTILFGGHDEHPPQGAVPVDDHVEPVIQDAGGPQTVSDVVVQAVTVELFTPKHDEQAVQGADPEEDQERATQGVAGTQALLEVLPGGEVCPVGQSEHIKAPAREYFPAGQGPEQFGLPIPIVCPQVPAGQFVQSGSPAKEYFPRTHNEHMLLDVAAGEDVVPARQVPEQDAFVRPI